ncbi:MAG: hypothetical protein ACREER_01355, partial [Alphaproteobacteria bacterium]
GRFRVTVCAPLAPPGTGDAGAADTGNDVAALLGAIHATFEDWIRARPDHWLWLHRRWPD